MSCNKECSNCRGTIRNGCLYCSECGTKVPEDKPKEFTHFGCKFCHTSARVTSGLTEKYCGLCGRQTTGGYDSRDF